MRWTALVLVALLGACVGGSDGDEPETDTDPSGGSTGIPDPSSSSSGSTGGSSNPTATSMPPGTEPADSTDGDESSSSSDGETTVATETDGSTTEGGGTGGGTIDVTLTGCDVDFGGTVVVSYNGSLGVASVYDMGATLTGSFQFDLDGPATMELGTQHRVDTGTVVNMVDIGQGTWTNMDSDALSGGIDSIGGTLDVQVWSPARGQAQIVFDGVSLMNVVNGNVCTIDGTVIAEELYP